MITLLCDMGLFRVMYRLRRDDSRGLMGGWQFLCGGRAALLGRDRRDHFRLFRSLMWSVSRSSPGKCLTLWRPDDCKDHLVNMTWDEGR